MISMSIKDVDYGEFSRFLIRIDDKTFGIDVYPHEKPESIAISLRALADEIDERVKTLVGGCNECLDRTAKG